MDKTWNECSATYAMENLMLIDVMGETAYWRLSDDVLETIALSAETENWCYCACPADDMSEELYLGYGETPEEAKANAKPNFML